MAGDMRPSIAVLDHGQWDGLSSLGARDRQSICNRGIVGDDPLPFGLARNRTAMEGMVAMDVGQKIIPHEMDVDGLFAAGAHDLD